MATGSKYYTTSFGAAATTQRIESFTYTPGQPMTAPPAPSTLTGILSPKNSTRQKRTWSPRWWGGWYDGWGTSTKYSPGSTISNPRGSLYYMGDISTVTEYRPYVIYRNTDDSQIGSPQTTDTWSTTRTIAYTFNAYTPVLSGYQLMGWSIVNNPVGTGSAEFDTTTPQNIDWGDYPNGITVYPVWGASNNVHVNVGGTWKDGKVYVNVNGTWKEGTPYVNVNGVWKQGK